MSNLAAGARAGIGTLTIEGEPLDIAKGAKYKTNQVTRETLKGQSGIQGFKVGIDAPMIGATVRDAGSMTTADFMAMTSVSVVLVLANGKSVSGDGMWCVKAEAIETEEGTFDLEFEGYFVTEITV
jgi:hypothetical protein